MRERATDITGLLQEWSEGNLEALDKLLPMVIDKVRDLARKALARESPGHTLQPTELVNEVYLKLVRRRTFWWRDRAQFFATLAELIRRILVDHARRRNAVKRGAGARELTLDELILTPNEQSPHMLALDEALERLEEIDPQRYQIVAQTYFVGLTHEEVARALGISLSTVRRQWKSARLWLLGELGHDTEAESTAR